MSPQRTAPRPADPSGARDAVPGTGAGGLLLGPLLRMTRALREASVPVSASEVIDATRALDTLDVRDRSAVRGALAATLIKRAEDRSTFDTLFDIAFAVRPAGARGDPADRDAGEGSHGPPGARSRDVVTSLDRPVAAGDVDDPSTELLEALIEALRRGDHDRLRELADLAVARFGAIAERTGATERYFLYRVLRALELSRLMARALAAERAEREDDGLPGDADDRRFRAELAARVETFKRLLAQQVRAHLADLVGAADAARGTAHLGIEETDFQGASPRQLAAMREAIRPLARALATRMARRRRRRDRGRLDVRRTVRHSLSSGGVPLEPVFRRPRVARPDLYLLCDVSGSVAEFASFTLTLLQAITAEISRMRSFAFVDGVDEVTGHLREVASFLEVRHVLYRADVVAGDGHSDYGAAMERFWQRHGGSIDSRSTIIVTGDARSNGRPPSSEVWRELHERARRVYLLNPEPADEWDTTDSIVSVYRPYLDGVFETRNLAQLGAAVLRIT